MSEGAAALWGMKSFFAAKFVEPGDIVRIEVDLRAVTATVFFLGEPALRIS